MRSITRAAGALLLVVVAGGLATLWPSQLGGSTAYVSTYGASMEPGFTQGDLAIVRPAERYNVGDVVAYHSELLDTVVLHRIIEVANGRYRIQGDNNGWVDRDEPDHTQIIGALWWRIAHGGQLLAHARKLLPAVVGLVVLAGATTTHHNRNKRRATAMSHRTTPTSTRALRSATLTFVCVALTFGSVAAYGFTQPTHKAVNNPIPYAQHAQLGYTAAPVDGPVYENGEIRTGEPAYLRLIDQLTLELSYELSSKSPITLAGTISTVAELSNNSGWARTIELTKPQHFEGPDAQQTTTLDLQAIRRLVTEVQSATGLTNGTYALNIITHITARGSVAGRDLNVDFNPNVAFQLDANQLRPTEPNSDPGEPFETNEPSAVINRTNEPARIELAGLGATVGLLRSAALAIGAAAALGALVAHRALRRKVPGEAAKIELRHGHRIIPISTAAAGTQLLTADLASIEDLVRLAQQHDCLILHQTTRQGDSYHFQSDRTIYRYHARDPAHDQAAPAS